MAEGPGVPREHAGYHISTPFPGSVLQDSEDSGSPAMLTVTHLPVLSVHPSGGGDTPFPALQRPD